MPAPYAPQTWVDNTTPVDAAHMSHIESGIASADDAHTYLGDYNAGTTYYDGDIVVAADGFAYLCVKDGVTGSAPVAFPGSNGGIPLPVVNGQWVKGVGGAAVWSAIAAADLPPQAVPGYGTTLPASPTDGQEFVLVDSTTNPSYQWRFRYNAGNTTAYKWEFVGGPPGLMPNVGAFTVVGDSTNRNITSLTAPRAGVYRVQGVLWGPSSAAGMWQLGFGVNAGSPAILGISTVTASSQYFMIATYPYDMTVAAGNTINLMYYANVGGAAGSSVGNAWVFPVRVS